MSRATTPPPAALTAVVGPVEARLQSLFDDEITQWSAVDPDLVLPLQSLRAFVLGGGKRLRPAFCHWAFIGAGGESGAATVIDSGAAMELLHAFALIHDDIMDGSETRRGASTVHTMADVPLYASGPGSELLESSMENTDVFFIMAAALGLGVGSTPYSSG